MVIIIIVRKDGLVPFLAHFLEENSGGEFVTLTCDGAGDGTFGLRRS